MNLWITRDAGDRFAVLWGSEPHKSTQPGQHNLNPLHDDYEPIDERWAESGTCTRLYPESDVRRMVAEASITAKSGVVRCGINYLTDPTDTNWHALESKIWAEGERKS